MPQYYADINQDGAIIGLYIDQIHSNIPETAVQISEEQWQKIASDSWRYKWDGTQIREKSEQELADERANQPQPKSPIQILEDENALLALELALAQVRLEQMEQEQADLLLMLVSEGVI